MTALSRQGCLFEGRDQPDSLPLTKSFLLPSHVPFSGSPHTPLLPSLQKLSRTSMGEGELAIHAAISHHFSANQLHLILKSFVSKLST